MRPARRSASIGPARETFTAAYARERGVDATSGHDVSSTYGLRARTRTAALNAAMLPKMVRTSRMTAAAVERAAIPAPLMIMRSDGGVMDVREIERRPILTLLSGPAAGVAGALLYENLSDGIFVEVGGTSSDCSAIRGGRPQMRPARIGGHRTMLRTLDVRTLGLAGGSMLRVGSGGIADVGPRSAHIAGCAYACFTDVARLDGARIEMLAPSPLDPNDYAVLVAPDGTRIAPTRDVRGQPPRTPFPTARSRAGTPTRRSSPLKLLALHLGADAATLARSVLDVAARKLRAAHRRVDRRLRTGSARSRRRRRRRRRPARSFRYTAGAHATALAHRARRRGDRADRRGAGARARRRRTHDRQPDAGRRRAHPARGGRPRGRRGRGRRTASRLSSRSTRNAIASARRPRGARPWSTRCGRRLRRAGPARIRGALDERAGRRPRTHRADRGADCVSPSP